MDIAHPAAEIDHIQPITEKPSIFTELCQPARPRLVKYLQLGDSAATAVIVESF